MRINFYDLRLTDSGGVALVKERGTNYEDGMARSPEQIALLADQLLKLGEKAEEHVYLLSLNSACRVTGICLISRGTVCSSTASPREIYIRALLTGAVQIVLCHNHPSGSVIPTEEDIKVTKTRQTVAEILAKHTGHSVGEVFEKTKADSFFSAGEAVAWHLADRIITEI